MKKLIPTIFKILSKISPRLAANFAFKLFIKVRKKDIRKREKPFYEMGEPFEIPFKGEPIHAYKFGKPSKNKVLLIHGWDSNAGSLLKFIDPLLKKGKEIIAMNLPGHAHYNASTTNFFECKEAVKTLINSLDKDDNVTIISHSFGSALTGHALSETNFKANNLFFLTSPNKMDLVFIEFKNMIKLGKKAYDILLERANNIIGEDLTKLYIHDKLKKANFNHLYLFHDEFDKIISINNTYEMNKNIPNSTVFKYQKIGHYRMLWTEKLIEDVIELI